MSKLPEMLKGKKGSDTFLEYAEPYLLSYMQSTGKTDLESIEKILRIPWMIWNATVLGKKPGNAVDYMASIQLLINHFPAEIKVLIDGLKIRKETLFSQYDYLFSKYKLYIGDNDEIKLSMETRSADASDPNEFCSL
jgi:hypothetical protein